MFDVTKFIFITIIVDKIDNFERYHKQKILSPLKCKQLVLYFLVRIATLFNDRKEKYINIF